MPPKEAILAKTSDFEECEEFGDVEDFEGEEFVIVVDEGKHVNCIVQKVPVDPSQPIQSQRQLI